MVDEDKNTVTTLPTPPSPPPSRGRSAAGGLALLLSLIALLGTGYLWYVLSYQTHTLGLHVARRLHSQDRALTRLNRAIAGVAQTQARVQQGLQALNRQQQAAHAAHDGHWRIRATRDLLLIANDQLHFEHDVPLALLALHQAQNEMRREQDPQLLPVRRAIAQEILRLRALRRQHVSTMAIDVIALAHAVPTLPLAVPTVFRSGRITPKKESAKPHRVWRRIGESLWTDFVSLIRIHKQQIDERALLIPKRAYFVRQNVQLRLYAAELALLEHHTAVMHANLAAADRWLTRYFDLKAPAVQAVHKTLQKLKVRSAALKWPDISGSLHILRRLTRNAS